MSALSTSIQHFTPTMQRRLTLALLSLGQFIVVLDFSIVNVALPSIQRELGFSPQGLQWIFSAYSLTFGGFLLLGGRAADLFGRRRLFMAGLALFTVASLLGGLAPFPLWLIVARAFQGLGSACIAPTVLSLLTTSFPEGSERNNAMGVIGSVASAGFTAGVVLGGLLTAGPGWRWVMFVNVPLGVLAIAATPALLPESRETTSQDTSQRYVDVAGAVAVTAGLIALIYAIVQGNGAGWFSAPILAIVAIAVALLAAFVAIERRVPAPLVPLAIFRRRTLTGANLVGLLAPGMFGAMLFVLTLYWQDARGFSALQTGLAFLPLALALIVTTNASTRLVTRFGVKPMLLGGLVLAGAGMLWLSRIGSGGGYLDTILPGLLLVAIGMGPVFPGMAIAATDGVENEEQGLASGLINTSQQVGGGLGLAIIAAIIAAHATATTRNHTATLTSGFQIALLACAAMALVSLLITLLVIRERG